jgi:hypothetical protein
MTPEDRNIPDWAQRERQADFGWIQENLDVFWTVATTALEDAGRGAIVVDTTLEPVPGAGNPFAYFSQDQVEERGDEDTQRRSSSLCFSNPTTTPAPIGARVSGGRGRRRETVSHRRASSRTQARTT